MILNHQVSTLCAWPHAKSLACINLLSPPPKCYEAMIWWSPLVYTHFICPSLHQMEEKLSMFLIPLSLNKILFSSFSILLLKLNPRVYCLLIIQIILPTVLVFITNKQTKIPAIWEVSPLPFSFSEKDIVLQPKLVQRIHFKQH